MKVNSKIVDQIEHIVRTAQKVGIDSVVIESDIIRAIDEHRTVVMNHKHDLDLPFSSIGLTRTNVFLSRLDIARTQTDLSVDVNVDDDKDFVKSIVMKSKGVKVDFRCGDPSNIKAPKSVNDELVCGVKLDPTTVVLLQRGQNAMNTDVVTIVSNDERIFFELQDDNGDKLDHTFENQQVNSINDGDTHFVHTYPLKIILPLFKENPEQEFLIGKKGILNISLGGINMFVLPQVR